MTRKLVLDTNCIIDLEENRPDARHLKALMGAWKSGRTDLAVVAVSASENQPGGSASRDFGVFEKKLNNVGLADVHHLLPSAIWDVFYWDHALWSSPEMKALESQIRGILFPGIPTVPPSNIDENSVWRNHMCDVLVAWSCIHHKWGCLVTRDKNFHNIIEIIFNLFSNLARNKTPPEDSCKRVRLNVEFPCSPNQPAAFSNK